MCLWLCTTFSTQYSTEQFWSSPLLPPDKHHNSYVVYRRRRGWGNVTVTGILFQSADERSAHGTIVTLITVGLLTRILARWVEIAGNWDVLCVSAVMCSQSCMLTLHNVCLTTTALNVVHPDTSCTTSILAADVLTVVSDNKPHFELRIVSVSYTHLTLPTKRIV